MFPLYLLITLIVLLLIIVVSCLKIVPQAQAYVIERPSMQEIASLSASDE